MVVNNCQKAICPVNLCQNLMKCLLFVIDGVTGVQAFHRGLGGVPEQEGGQEGGGTAQQHPG